MYILAISHPNEQEPTKIKIGKTSIHGSAKNAESEAVRYLKCMCSHKEEWIKKAKSFDELLELVKISDTYDITIHSVTTTKLI